jgi:hypothetical protein
MVKEGAKSLFGGSNKCSHTVDRLTRAIQAGAGANILRGVAAAGALSLYDKYGCPASVFYPFLIQNTSTDSKNSPGERYTKLDLVKCTGGLHDAVDIQWNLACR